MNNMQFVLDERQSCVLAAVVREHVRTAEPVGSALVAERYRVRASAATIRNDMADLEAQGYIHQPHTSAGRVPTDKAYQYFVDHLMKSVRVTPAEENIIREQMLGQTDERERIKNAAKAVAELVDESVFLAFAKRDVYVTGLTYLFSQPEFSEPRYLFTIGAIIDRLDEAAADLFDLATEDVQVLIGNSRFGEGCSVVVTRYHLGSEDGVFGVLGPTRMNYERTVALVNCLAELRS